MRQRIFPILAVLLLAAALPGCQDAAAGDRAGLFIHFIDPEQTSSALLLCGGQEMCIRDRSRVSSHLCRFMSVCRLTNRIVYRLPRFGSLCQRKFLKISL